MYRVGMCILLWNIFCSKNGTFFAAKTAKTAKMYIPYICPKCCTLILGFLIMIFLKHRDCQWIGESQRLMCRDSVQRMNTIKYGAELCLHCSSFARKTHNLAETFLLFLLFLLSTFLPQNSKSYFFAQNSKKICLHTPTLWQLCC